MTAHEKEGTERKENIMSTLSRRQFLRASGTVVGATLFALCCLRSRMVRRDNPERRHDIVQKAYRTPKRLV